MADKPRTEAVLVQEGPQRLGDVRWEGFTHHHMWNMIMDAEPNDVFGRYRRWQDLGTELASVDEAVQSTLNTLFGAWQGVAAMRAAQANTRLLAWAQEATEISQGIGEQLGGYGNALVQARKTMPVPRALPQEQAFRAGQDVTVDSDLANSYVPLQLMTDHLATTRERVEAREGAIAVMRAFESEAYNVREEVRATGTFEPTPQVTVVNAPGPVDHEPPPYVPPPVPPLPPGPYPPVPPGGPGYPPGEEGPVDTEVAGVPGGGGPGTGPGGGPGGGWWSGGGLSGLPGQGQGGQSGGGPGGAGFGALGPGGAGGAGGAGSAAAGRVPGFGAVPGGAAAAEAAALRGAGSAGGAGAAGRGGMGGMYPPMGGAAGGDDDTEKPLARYLEADDLFDDERTVAPPVFGA